MSFWAKERRRRLRRKNQLDPHDVTHLEGGVLFVLELSLFTTQFLVKMRKKRCQRHGVVTQAMANTNFAVHRQVTA